MQEIPDITKSFSRLRLLSNESLHTGISEFSVAFDKWHQKMEANVRELIIEVEILKDKVKYLEGQK